MKPGALEAIGAQGFSEEHSYSVTLSHF